MKKLLGTIIGSLLLFGVSVWAAPVATFQPSVIPNIDARYYLGTTTPKMYWANLYTNTLTVSNGTATTTINAGDVIPLFAYPFTPTSNLGQTMSATSSSILITGSNGFYANGASQLSTTTINGYLNTGILTATTSAYLGSLTLGTKLANAQLANSSIIVTTASPLGGAGTIALGDTLALTCTGCLTSLAGAASSTLLGDENKWSGVNTFSKAITLSTTTIQGYFNTGVLTATTSAYLSSLTLGTKLANTELANSTISGVALGGTLGELTATNGTLTFSATYTGASAVTIGLNLNSGNLWTASTTYHTVNTGTLIATSSIKTNTLQATASSTFAGFYNTGNATTSGNFTVINGQSGGCIASSTANAVSPQLINWNNCNHQKWLVTADTEFIVNSTSSNPCPSLCSSKFILDIRQDSTGGRAVKFIPVTLFSWEGGNAATTSFTTAGANQHMTIGFLYEGASVLYHALASTTPVNFR